MGKKRQLDFGDHELAQSYVEFFSKTEGATDQEFFKAQGIASSTWYHKLKNPNFKALLNSLNMEVVSKFQAASTERSVQNKAYRMEKYQSLSDRLDATIRHSLGFSMAKSLPSLCSAHLAVLKQVAIETGEWEEKTKGDNSLDVNFGGYLPSDVADKIQERAG